MSTDEEKSRLAKLLDGLEVPETKLSERCSDLVREFEKKFANDLVEGDQPEPTSDVLENPYRVDRELMEENERKLRELLAECKRVKQRADCANLKTPDPKRPWRTNSNKEKLLRIDNEIKQHIDRASDFIAPMAEDEMRELVKTCREENLIASPITADRLANTVDAAKKNLANFQYRKIQNSTATMILPEAHELKSTAVTPSP